MVKTFIVFGAAFLAGVVLQGALVHNFFPSAIAPDVILILVVYLGLHSRSALGALGAFGLGLSADFASAQYLGPNAAACVVAYLLILQIANKIYTEQGFAVSFVTFVASVVKSICYALMLWAYTSIDIFTVRIARIVIFEALITAVVAPFVLWFMRSAGTLQGQAKVELSRRR